MAIVGYIRVSTVDQNVERQLYGVNLDKVFTDKASASGGGKNDKREQLKMALNYLREDDEFVIHSIDRLARNLRELEQIVDDLVARGVTVRFYKENLVFSPDANINPMNRLLLQMLGAFAQFERSMIRERQAEGIAIARAKGKLGRKKALTKGQTKELSHRKANGESVTALAKEFGVARQTIYTAIKTDV